MASSARILIVDNDSSATQDLQVRLSKLGYEVVGTAATRQEALYETEKLKPSVVLMNTRLRIGNDGVKTGSLIQASSNTPIVYFSSRAGQDTIRQVGSTGPFGYMIMPVEDSQLFVTIEIAEIRSRLESQLREGKQWLNGVLMSIGDGVIAVDDMGIIRFINPRAKDLTGSYKMNAIGKVLSEVLKLKDERSGELLDLSSRLLEARDGSTSESSMEALLLSNDGNHVPVQMSLNPIIEQGNNLIGMVFAFRDISSQRLAVKQIKLQTSRAEALLKVAEQLNSRIEIRDVLDTVCAATNQILNTSATMVFLYDPKSNQFKDVARKIEIDHPRAAWDSMQFTFSRDTLQAFLPADNSVFSVPDVAIRREVPYSSMLRLLKVRALAVAPLLRNNNVIGILVGGSIGSDRIYSRDELEMLKGLANHVSIAISNASMFEQMRIGRERQRKLAKGLIEVQEAERRTIARDLHDHFGQSLTGLQFLLESVKDGASDSHKQQLVEIQAFVGDIISQVRELSLNLRPSMLDDMGLLPTLKWHFERFAHQTGIEVDFHSDEFSSRFPGQIETTSYRIIQEALTNVARYAQVATVSVRLARQEDSLLVEVRDQGKGFDVSRTSEKPTLGLGGMRERANLVGGHLVVNSSPNQGTQILATLPLGKNPIERRRDDRNGPPG